jgi:ABC-type protease/lipase transport system fused ATPase/permease subunit
VRVLRAVLQSAVLGLGAYLAIVGEATAGVMNAASILVSLSRASVEMRCAQLSIRVNIITLRHNTRWLVYSPHTPREAPRGQCQVQ